jgi:methylase of polypeptide subunit release factors
MTIIASVLRSAELPESPTARLDVELLLAAALGKPRSYLHTWPERIVSSEAAHTFGQYLARRRGGEPVAYILGQQGFWKLDLEVAPHTLIPRPETELLVEAALQLPWPWPANARPGRSRPSTGSPKRWTWPSEIACACAWTTSAYCPATGSRRFKASNTS